MYSPAWPHSEIKEIFPASLVAACERTKTLEKFQRKLDYQLSLFSSNKPKPTTDMPKHKQLLSSDKKGNSRYHR